jgi:hypothetical protein
MTAYKALDEAVAAGWRYRVAQVTPRPVHVAERGASSVYAASEKELLRHLSSYDSGVEPKGSKSK